MNLSRRLPRRGAVLLGALLLVVASRPAWATRCRALTYAFEPDCFVRDAKGSCAFDPSRPDLGPQVAVWVETSDGRFVDTLFVTNAVGLYGIGNRPGRSDLRSGPRFPYGRRPMALPVWAHRRGKIYPAVVAKDGREDTLVNHETVSSPEPHFCRPMMPSEVVDAVTCASGRFRSDKGILDPAGATSFYPPRGDLLDWASACVPVISSAGSACEPGDAAQFETLNDLDAVAGATPAYDEVFRVNWPLPDDLAAGSYAIFVEVGKEMDQNASFSFPSFLAPDDAKNWANYGWSHDLGQPSVVYAVPFTVTDDAVAALGPEERRGSGDPTGESGAIQDAVASSSSVGPLDDSPGSGWGRLRVMGADGGHIQLSSSTCEDIDCSAAGPPSPPRIVTSSLSVAATSASLSFFPADDHGQVPLGYEVRAVLADGPFFDASGFTHWPTVALPAPDASVAAVPRALTVDALTPQSTYALGIRARGRCGWSAPSLVRLTTTAPHYQQLSGCVVATAAFGSPDEPHVAHLRHWRDQWAASSPWGALAAALYASSAPPLAHALARSDTLRAWVRDGLGTGFALLSKASASPSPVVPTR